MKQFDVIIVGAGPAGLQCAKILGKSDLKVLLLEKDKSFGNKVCAGGITRKDLDILDLPDSIIEHKITHTAIHSRKRSNDTIVPDPFVFTVNRNELGAWQREQLKTSGVEVLTNSKVTSIEKGHLIVNGSSTFGFKYLVGSDGVNSIVRKHLQIPTEKLLIGIQYNIPGKFDPKLEIFMDSKLFGSWYAWIFPHRGSIAVGAVCDPKMMSSKLLKDNFHVWIKQKGLDISNATYSSWPISYDYRGIRFDNTFLAGEAAGLASGFTGEGIYQSLVSGETVAKTILDKNHNSKEFVAVLKYNSIQNKIMKTLSKAGPLRGPIQETIVMALNNPAIQKRINRSFS